MNLRKVVNGIYEDIKYQIGQGRVADYIPELAKVNPGFFGMSIALEDGSVYSSGDSGIPFSIQSISKVFLLTIALQKIDEDIWKRVGREPSGSSFDSIVQLEHDNGIPRNPFVNAGAIVVTDAVLENSSVDHEINSFLDFVRDIAHDPSVYIDSVVANSEIETGYRNFALANFIRSYGNIKCEISDVLKFYFYQCSLMMSCLQLAKSGLYLACRGYNPLTSKNIISPLQSRCVNAVMLTCGHYDNSGDFAYRVGFPGKSGVGGGILAIVPSKASIAVWSPGLNNFGNSLLGAKALELLAVRTGWSIFDPLLI
ncbi:glutaminase [Candidatus Liberibacter africanus]|uniref:Glutaminase n=1 Tax=Candidatus Liberibacter africanus PTSAPSY TaxID=1277257 RepID=A0A0G3I1H2_LIBAF|nr:glutaminase [Candidatus Liberibacter africanus]AKK19721.1 glutaminase [Candidatus Liberibacter africanus PTSAPSY]QTP63605.1 glutaminase [Candidatus Liberibacter africanus]